MLRVIHRGRDVGTAFDKWKFFGLGLLESDGAGLLESVKRVAGSPPVVLMSDRPTIDQAVAALRKGAFDFLPKPFHEQDLLRIVGYAHRRHALEQQSAFYRNAALTLFAAVSLAMFIAIGVIHLP